MGKQIRFTDIEIQQIVTLYTKQYKSTTEIAKLFNCDASVIISRLKNAGVNIVSGSAFSVQYWIKRGLSKTDAEKKIKTLKPVYIEYWMNLGYSEDDAKFQIELHLMNTERAYIYKFGVDDGIRKFKEYKDGQGKFNSKRSLEYWTSRGYSENDAKNEIKKSQAQFSLEKCIEKYGENIGRIKWKSRQTKWQNSLQNNSNIELINKSKDVRSIQFYKKKCGDDWLYCYLQTHINKKYFLLLQKIFDCCQTENDIIDYFVKNVDYNVYVFRAIAYNKAIIEYYKINPNKLLNQIKLGYNINCLQSFGYQKNIGEHITKSLGEYNILKFLIENKIEYRYDEPYPKQITKNKLRYDFYLPKFNIYIEYTGMLNLNDRKNEQYKKIRQKYVNRIEEKMAFCQTNNINCYFMKNSDDIIKLIKNLYEKENNIK